VKSNETVTTVNLRASSNSLELKNGEKVVVS